MTERRFRLSLVIVALVLHLPSFLIPRPLILPDEAGFLLSGYQLGAGRPPSGMFYYPGYSLLLAPIAALSTELGRVMLGVHVLNALLAVGTMLLTAALAERLLPRAERATIWAIAALVQLYPAFRLFSSFALSENLFLPISLAVAVMAIEIERRPRAAWPAIALGITGGLSFAVHARAVSITAATGVALLVVARRRPRQAALGLVAVAVSALVAIVFVRTTLTNGGVDVPYNDTESTFSSIVDKNRSWSAVDDWILGGIGQLFYLAIATAGCFVAALAATWPGWRDRQPLDARALPSALTVVAPMVLLSFGVSVLFMSGAGGDPAIYGRYNEGVVAPVLVIGLASLTERRWAERTLWLASWFAPAAALVLVVARGPEFFQGRRQMINITAIHPITDSLGSIRIAVVAAVGVAVLLAIRSLFARSFVIGCVGIGLLWTATWSYDLRNAVRAIDVLDEQDHLLDAIAELGDRGIDTDCVSLDLTGIGDRWHQSNYRLRRVDIDFRYWLGQSGTPSPCPDLVISRQADLAAWWPGASLVAVEPWNQMGLWVLPGGVQTDALDGRAPIEAPFSPIGSTQTIEIEIVDAPTSLTVGDVAEVSVRLTNLGPRALVPHLGLEGPGGVDVGLEWRDPNRPTVRLIEPMRIALPAIVWPGDTVELTGEFVANNAPIALGRWLLVAGVVQEGVAWLPPEAATELTVGGR